MDFDFEDWMMILNEHARKRGHVQQDPDSWKENWVAGEYPEEAFDKEWGTEPGE